MAGDAPTSFTLKKLDQHANYAEIVRYLQSVESVIFQFENLPPDEPPAQIYCPPLEYPQATAKEWAFQSRPRISETDEQRYLFIGDIFKLIDQVQAKLIADGEYLVRTNPNSEIGDKVAKLVAAEKDFFTLTNLQSTDERISIGQEDYLLRYREDRRREITDRLNQFAEIAREVAHELGEDIEVTEEIKAEIEPDVGEGIAPIEPETAASTPHSYDNNSDGGEQSDTPQDQPPERPDRRPPTEELTVKQQFENLRALTFESERLTNAYLNRFAEEYGIPIEMLQGEFKDVVRRNFQANITQELGLHNINELYANAVLRKSFLDNVYLSLNEDPDFGVNLNHIVESRYEILKKAGDRTELTKLQERLEKAKSGDDYTRFKEGILADSVFETIPEISLTSSDPQADLRAVCSTLPYFDQGRLDYDLLHITEKIDALISRDETPIFLDKLSANRFNLIFNTSLTPEQFAQFKPTLATYWHLRNHEYEASGVKLGYRDPNDQFARADELSSLSDAEFAKKHVQPLNHIVGTAHSNNGSARDHVIAIGTGRGDETVEKKFERPEELYIKKLKRDIFNQKTWRSLSRQEQIAIYDFYYGTQYSEADVQDMLSRGHVPEKFCLADVGEARISMAQYGINDGYYNWDEFDDSPFATIDTGLSPLASLRRRMAGKKGAAGQAVAATSGKKAKKAMHGKLKKGARKAGRKLSKKTAEGMEKAVDKTIAKADIALLNAAGAALGLPGLGTVTIGVLPPKVQEFIGKLSKYGVIGAAAAGIAGALATAYIWATSLGAKIGSVVGTVAGPLGSLLGTWVGYGIERSIAGGFQSAGNFFTNLFGGGGTATTTTSGGAATATATTTYSGTISNPLSYGYGPGGAGGTGGALSPSGIAYGVKTGVFTSAQVIAGQAVAWTAGGLAVGSIFINLLVAGAFLADFPNNLTSITNPNEKLSKYATLMKVAATGCPDDKCPELAPGEKLTVEYTITITPTGNNTCITITEVNDILKTTYSKKKYEELGKPLPSKPDREKHVADFPELSTNRDDPKNTACIGESIILTYKEEFDASYNHSSIRNTFEAKFYWKDATGEGTDSVMTSKQFCIGDCSMEAGCWPTTGEVSQAPFGSYSHSKMDAFDIANSAGQPIYAPFAGELCKASVDGGYGNHAMLTAEEGTYLFGHMSDMYVSGCQQVEAGYVIGLMGSTGNSSGPHLHFEKSMNGGWFRASPPSVIHPPDPTQAIMPPSDGTHTATKGQLISPITQAYAYKVNVTSCYDGTQ